ncbi:hypothetical protein PV327_002925 [Microctonus hyperodae]|uniref:Peptidase S1 domain-containing protein n=1 Tax=Microctonus hyperodae TaxID=165561 RepID=A0AA39G2Y3_MICHY|nr:hypothetical protein PV327_002925 [Microctonus hyperodae]
MVQVASAYFVREYSYHVSIQFNGQHECSGSIINNRHILTALPCVISTSAKDLSVLVGTTSLKSGGVLYKIEDIILPDNPFDNIALLRTRNEINFDYNVYKIDIANFNFNINGDGVLITAWEKPPKGVKRSNDDLQHFFHQFYDQRDCMRQNRYVEQVNMCTIDPTGQGLCNVTEKDILNCMVMDGDTEIHLKWMKTKQLLANEHLPIWIAKAGARMSFHEGSHRKIYIIS